MGGLQKSCKEPYRQQVDCIIKLCLSDAGESGLHSDAVMRGSGKAIFSRSGRRGALALSIGFPI